ncbi:MAG: alpha-glucosidase [Erysipelotrichaceae bacterium]|nr:alpha-glucosidase [Erysipelotrichaceae bacterium]
MKWWENKTVYQIYPKSFLDTDDDGIGNLRGIIDRLDYLKSLNIDLLWISPCYASPMADEGYDISDYYQINPLFGNMDDFDELLFEAKKRDIGILMDLVVNHCSDEHFWFKKAIEDPDGKYGKYFYIEDFDGVHYPNNLRSVFGGRAWEVLPGHPDKVYLHTFHKKQPDLNWENQEVRQEIFTMIKWWLDKGLAGFRVDAINHIKKDLPFRDYEPDQSDGLVAISTMLDHARGLDELLYELRDECFVPYDAFTVGEVFGITKEKMEKNIGKNGYFSTIFDFSASHYGRNYEDQTKTLKVLSGEDYKNAEFQAMEDAKDIGTLSLVIENHDQPRAASHFIRKEDICETSKKLLAGIYFFAKGIPFIYQGQEIGMENLIFESRDELLDIDAKNMYDTIIRNGYSIKEALDTVSALSRDNARTPVQWNDKPNAGFSNVAPWQRVNPNYININVEEQETRKDSLLNFYRSMTALRKDPEYNETFAIGSFEPYLSEQKNLIAYYRRHDDKTLLILANAQKEERNVEIPDGEYQVLLNNYEEAEFNSDGILLKGYQFLVCEVKASE